MSDTHATTQGWIVKIRDTGREYHFYAGDSVIIGRTPLRPASVGEGETRLDVDDPGKSMSKRHARFTVNANGSATIHDLHSTNGTYIVRSDGELMRLPLDQDYTLARTPLRLQLGDVAVEIHREISSPAGRPVERPAQQPANDLFSYAAQTAPEGVDAPSLSVDQILDVRAGEPTQMFDANKVRQQVSGRQTRLEQQEAAASTSGFAKMKQDLEAQSQAQKAQQEQQTQTPSAQTDSTPQNHAEPASETETKTQTAAGTLEQESEPAAAEQPTATADSEETPFEAAASASQSFVQVNDTSTEQQYQPYQRPAAGYEAPQEGRGGQRPQDSGAVFEPGSVFDRLTRGELDHHEPAVQIGELNSDDAQRTADQTAQFEMAKHHELLPFLALNPHLYDDLYAWLEAIGDPDIDSALRSNAGYGTYREGRK
ncbi:MAG: FHA domain-containing protein [Bifidobacteriaceae bacterium]|nr:FHA domain-containing protein [Bifidobacteriaceae bacterium]